jgi:alanine dehydrogenase
MVPLRCKYVRFAGVRGIISSSYDVFANAQRIVKVKEAKSEERTVTKSQHPIFSYESLADKALHHGPKAEDCAF